MHHTRTHTRRMRTKTAVALREPWSVEYKARRGQSARTIIPAGRAKRVARRADRDLYHMCAEVCTFVLWFCVYATIYMRTCDGATAMCSVDGKLMQ